MGPRQKHRERYWNTHDRSNYECPDCGCGVGEVSHFQVHHKDGDPTNGEPSNLVALCRECHHDRHGDWIRNYTPQGIRERDKQYIGRS